MRTKTNLLGSLFALAILVLTNQGLWAILSSTDPAMIAEQELFVHAYRTNAWYGRESRSGIGASLAHTKVIREELPLLFQQLGIRTMVDIACGDFNWMKTLDLSFLDSYIGMDIVPELMERNNQLYGSATHSFVYANVITDPIPKADVIICRSLLPLLFDRDVIRVINNIKRSGAQFLIVSNYPEKSYNIELPKILRPVIWIRPINLEHAPFNFPPPLATICEGEEGPLIFDKSLALWRIEDIPELPESA